MNIVIPKKPTPRRARSARFTDAEWRQIEAAAAMADTQPSTWLRAAALAAARRALAEEAAA